VYPSKTGAGSAAEVDVEFAEEKADAPFDVVANETHSFDTVDAAPGHLISVPSLEPRFRDRFDLGFASERHNDVNAANEFRVNGLWCLVTDVDTNFDKRLGGQVVDLVPVRLGVATRRLG
jgi:hypothetical protein